MPVKPVKRKSSKKAGRGKSFASVIIYIGVLFTLLLGGMKILFNYDGAGWFGVFVPVMLAFAILSIARMAGKILSRL